MTARLRPVRQALGLKDSAADMAGVDYETALEHISNGKSEELFHTILDAYVKYAADKKFVFIAGVTLPVQSLDINLAVAAILQVSHRVTIHDLLPCWSLHKRQMTTDTISRPHLEPSCAGNRTCCYCDAERKIGWRVCCDIFSGSVG